MSTILDALRKSEQERRLNDVPVLSDMPTPNESSRWPILLLLITLIVLLALMALVVKKVWFSSEQVSVPASIQETLESSSSPASIDVSADTAKESDEVFTASTPKNILVVNVVSYSTDPAKRFVMIDGDLLREGEFVKAGVKVEEIRQNEVVLNSRGEKIVRRP